MTVTPVWPTSDPCRSDRISAGRSRTQMGEPLYFPLRLLPGNCGLLRLATTLGKAGARSFFVPYPLPGSFGDIGPLLGFLVAMMVSCRS